MVIPRYQTGNMGVLCHFTLNGTARNSIPTQRHNNATLPWRAMADQWPPSNGSQARAALCCLGLTSKVATGSRHAQLREVVTYSHAADALPAPAGVRAQRTIRRLPTPFRHAQGQSSEAHRRHGLPHSWPQSVISTFFEVLPEPEPSASMALTTFMPSLTSPNTTCLPSSQLVTTVVTKN